MRTALRRSFSPAAALLALALGACGGGGSTGGGTPAQVQGKVLSRDGSAQGLAGVEVLCEGGGASVTTEADGSFVLEVPDGTVVRLRFADPLAGLDLPAFPDCGEDEDATPDAGDLAEGVVEVEALAPGEVVTIEVELADGRVVECGVTRTEGGGVSVRCEGHLFPTDPFPTDPGAPVLSLAEIEVTQDGPCATLEVEAEHLEPGTTLHLVLVAPDGARETVASATVDELGALHAVLTRCEGDALPFGAEALTDLAGYGALVEDQDGNVLLAGQVPGLGYEFGEDGWSGPGGWGPGGEGGSLPPFPGDGFPRPPTDEEIQDLLDYLDDLLGGGSLLPGLPGLPSLPGFGR